MAALPLRAACLVTGTGLLERAQDAWNLRWPAYDLRPGPDDILVPSALVKKLALQPGVMLEVKVAEMKRSLFKSSERQRKMYSDHAKAAGFDGDGNEGKAHD